MRVPLGWRCNHTLHKMRVIHSLAGSESYYSSVHVKVGTQNLLMGSQCKTAFSNVYSKGLKLSGCRAQM